MEPTTEPAPGAEQPTTVAVCIATCRRPSMLERCLQSLAAQHIDPGLNTVVRVVVVDNDVDGAGLPVVERLAPGFPFALMGVQELERGISFARNTLVRMAEGSDYIAFIDDDETAEPQWLSELIRAAKESGADSVLGPVVESFEAPPAHWLRPLFVRPDHPHLSDVPTGMFRSGNLLLAMETLRRVPGPFDPAFALTGGSDSYLGAQLAAMACKSVWSAEARVHETTPASRTTLKWYLQRRYRTGLVFSMMQKRQRGGVLGGLRATYRGAGSLAVGTLGGCRSVAGDKTGFALAIGLMAYGVGNLAGVVGSGYREYDRTHGT